MLLLAVDPGIRGCGAALFDGGRLVAAAYVPSPCRSGNRAAEAAAVALAVAHWARQSAPGDVMRIDEVVVEWPRVYASMITSGHSPGDPNDLPPLAGVDAALVVACAAGLFGEAAPRTASYCPSEWKGQLPKAACARRVATRLSPAERALLDAVRPPSLAHNAWDAVGIGLHHLGRLAPRRFPGLA